MSARRPSRAGGFTLAEVMVALAILALALTLMVRSLASHVATSQQSMYMGIVADLARGKMYDIEEYLAQEGFKDTEEHEAGTFDDEGWRAIEWEYRIIPVELPSFEKLLGLAQGGGSGSGSQAEDADGDGTPDPQALQRFENSAINRMMSLFGQGVTTGDAAGGGGMGMVQVIYPMIQDVLKKSIRKIVLTIRWDTGLDREHIDYVLYVTDTAAMCKAIPGGVGCK